VYILKIRIGDSFFPVNWERGRLANDWYPPTVFDSNGRLEAEHEIARAVGQGNYLFEHTKENQPPHLETGDGNITILQFPGGTKYDT